MAQMKEMPIKADDLSVLPPASSKAEAKMRESPEFLRAAVNTAWKELYGGKHVQSYALLGYRVALMQADIKSKNDALRRILKVDNGNGESQ
jgi:hypothetical protein